MTLLSVGCLKLFTNLDGTIGREKVVFTNNDSTWRAPANARHAATAHSGGL